MEASQKRQRDPPHPQEDPDDDNMLEEIILGEKRMQLSEILEELDEQTDEVLNAYAETTRLLKQQALNHLKALHEQHMARARLVVLKPEVNNNAASEQAALNRVKADIDHIDDNSLRDVNHKASLVLTSEGNIRFNTPEDRRILNRQIIRSGLPA